jgi:hypothetical protein
MNSAPQLLFELDVPAAQESWTATLELAREQASGATYESWLKDLRLVRYAEGELVVAAPNEFRRNWVEKKYASLLARCAEGAFGSRPRMRFVTECPSDDTNSHVAAAGAKGGATRRIARPEPRERIPDEAFFGTVPLNPRYTFDTFVIGHSNRLAHAGAVTAAERPAGPPPITITSVCRNPLTFLHYDRAGTRPLPRCVSTRIPSVSAVTHVRTFGTPSTTMKHELHFPMAQKNPRGLFISGVSR